ARDRLTLAEVRQQILKQSPLFKPRDVIPVPCHPDCLAMAYALKLDGCVTPLTGMVDPQLLLHGEGNTIVYERNPQLRELLFNLFYRDKREVRLNELRGLQNTVPLTIRQAELSHT